MRYRTTKCPYCGNVIEDNVAYAKEKIGPPISQCPECGNSYATGMKYWQDMTGSERFGYILRSILLFPYTLFLYTLAFTLVPFLILSFLVDMDMVFERYFSLIVAYVVLAALTVTGLYIRGEIMRIKQKKNNENL